MSIPGRQINDAGLVIIMKFEGCELKAYRCPAGVLTIGYGSTGPHVHEGMEITHAEALALLEKDLYKFCDAVRVMVKPEITDNQFSALVCLAYNIGINALKNSTLMKKLNENDFFGAAAQFDVWNKTGGKVLEGLVKRREAERQLFET